jgi:hypothetical protein
MKQIVTALAIFTFVAVSTIAALAADDAAIPADVKERARAAMEQFVKHEVEVKGTFLLTDPVENKILSLNFDKLHKGMMKYQEGYLACAGFNAGKTSYDIDFLVKVVDGQYRVVKAAVHAVDGKKRTGHMER